MTPTDRPALTAEDRHGCVLGETNMAPLPRRRPTPMPLRWCAYIAWLLAWVVLGVPMVALAIISIIIDAVSDLISSFHHWLWRVAANGH